MTAPETRERPARAPVADVEHWIDGDFQPAASGAWLENVEPASGGRLCRVAAGDHRDIGRAVQAAVRAYHSGWASTGAAERAEQLYAIARGIEARAEKLAELESLDTGKPIALARQLDIPRAARNFRFFAGAILHTQTASHPMAGALNYTLRQPLGVAGLISPWNLPLYLLTWKVAPALAAGNTCVAKPSELTPLTARAFGEIAGDAGLPPGVLNIVHGEGGAAGAALCGHPRVPLISFTGGTQTGKAVTEAAAPYFKKLSLELGGKNANIVFADCDFEEAVDVSVRSSFANQGQICLCGSRIFVEEPIYQRFVEALGQRAAALRVGDPADPTTEFGALVSAGHRDQVAAAIELAVAEGATIVCGGKCPSVLPERCAGGFFLEPTVLTGLDSSCRTMQEEIFGPVVTISPFTDVTSVVDQANATRYGLSATLWTSDLTRAHRVAAALDVGTVWVNTWLHRDLRVPFGGTKDSGVGREGGEESLAFFTEAKNVCIKL